MTRADILQHLATLGANLLLDDIHAGVDPNSDAVLRDARLTYRAIQRGGDPLTLLITLRASIPADTRARTALERIIDRVYPARNQKEEQR